MKITSLIILLTSINVFAGDNFSCLPPNDMKIQVNTANVNQKSNSLYKSVGGLSQVDLKLAIKLFESVWSPIMEQKYNKKLIFKLEWQNNRVDTYTTRDNDNNPVIVVLGGLARHPDMTLEGMVLLFCHELGHHLGGAPKSFRGRSTKRSWSSAEGQADYFATSKCMPKIFSEALIYQFNSENNKSVDDVCLNANCRKVIPAGLSVGKVFASLKSDWKAPSIDKRSSKKVYRTFYKHPSPQCRFDTYIAGSLCSKEIDNDFDDTDHRFGSCLHVTEPNAARPKCWFSDSDY